MCKFDSKIKDLKSRITEGLLPLINDTCVYLDLPYHSNIGDTLIWEGTEQFITYNKIKCLYRRSKQTYYYQNLSPEVTILLHGGGNFGDIWREHQDLRLKIIQEYPNNPIIILPQTVYYSDEEVMQEDANIMKRHKNLIICARDEISYNRLKKMFFTNRILMLPDMAFYIPQNILSKYNSKKGLTNKTLLVKRMDKELHSFNLNSIKLDNEHLDIRDWPSLEKRPLYMKYFYIIDSICNKLKFISYPIRDKYAQYIIRPRLIKAGVHFISPYKYIYTTRLHVAILAILLHKPLIFIDNSYGKNSDFYNTWLADLKEVQFVK